MIWSKGRLPLNALPLSCNSIPMWQFLLTKLLPRCCNRFYLSISSYKEAATSKTNGGSLFIFSFLEKQETKYLSQKYTEQPRETFIISPYGGHSFSSFLQIPVTQSLRYRNWDSPAVNKREEQGLCSKYRSSWKGSLHIAGLKVYRTQSDKLPGNIRCV